MDRRNWPPRYDAEENDETYARNIRLLELYGIDAMVLPSDRLLNRNPLQRFSDMGRRFGEYSDMPVWGPPHFRPETAQGILDNLPHWEMIARHYRAREKQVLEAALEASAREEREAQEKRDAEEAARLVALERQIADDFAYAQALQYDTSSDPGDSDIITRSPVLPKSKNHNARTNLFQVSSNKATSTRTEGRGLQLTRTPTRETFVCAVCLDSYEYPNTIVCLACDHYYCSDCLSALFAGAISGAISRLNSQPFPPSCCKDHPILYDVVQGHLSAETRANYNRHRALLETPVEERAWCARDDCGEFIAPPQQQSAGRRASGSSNSATNLRRCTSCSTQTCTQCKKTVDEHMGGAGGVCPEDGDVKKLMKTAQRRGWRQCYRCKNMVEKRDGCNHMTCICRAEFCYLCGARWQNRDCSHGYFTDPDSDDDSDDEVEPLDIDME